MWNQAAEQSPLWSPTGGIILNEPRGPLCQLPHPEIAVTTVTLKGVKIRAALCKVSNRSLATCRYSRNPFKEGKKQRQLESRLQKRQRK